MLTLLLHMHTMVPSDHGRCMHGAHACHMQHPVSTCSQLISWALWERCPLNTTTLTIVLHDTVCLCGAPNPNPNPGHTSAALEIVKKRHLFALGGDKKQVSKVKVSRQ